ncbi:MAG TPA: BatA domain-containing protein, partial [Tepidisphaeraceae bacterium]|nr:BatA domain-containing protein [Tepidisphaeraceae bacterium]
MFLNALMLAGLGGAVLPIVLHLLARARYRTVDWGAMMFLAPAEARQHRSPRLRQLVLLAVRCGIVAVLATALARPVVRGGWAGLFGGGGGPVAAVLVLDCSASMAAADPRSGRTRIEAARDVATQVLAGLRRGDAVALLTPG